MVAASCDRWWSQPAVAGGCRSQQVVMAAAAGGDGSCGWRGRRPPAPPPLLLVPSACLRDDASWLKYDPSVGCQLSHPSVSQMRGAVGVYDPHPCEQDALGRPSAFQLAPLFRLLLLLLLLLHSCWHPSPRWFVRWAVTITPLSALDVLLKFFICRDVIASLSATYIVHR